MMTFFRRAIKNYRDACCRRADHFWENHVVRNANGEPTHIMVKCCTNCGAKYTWWKGEGA